MKKSVALVFMALLLPLLIAAGLRWIPPRGERVASSFADSPAASIPPDTMLDLQFESLSDSLPWRPKITNVQVVDLDRDGLNDVLACDAHRGQVMWHRQDSTGQWRREPLSTAEFPAPAHATATDLDGDGDLDVVLAILGSVWPTNHRIGGVVWLENQSAVADSAGPFVAHWILQDVRRVSDVQAGDLDADGDLDLAVAEFGYSQGSVRWLENRGGGRFRDRELLLAPGPIHVPIADFDRDGDLDIVALVSQEDEKVWAFENQGGGHFLPRPRVVWETLNFDLGAAGLSAVDLDRDGDTDLLLAAGDNLEINKPYPQPWHGCLWLENKGNWDFIEHRIATVGGAYASAAGDFDADGDLDVAVVSMFNNWRDPDAASLIWLENDGALAFRPWRIATSPTHLATVACGDLNQDGRDDIIAGGLHLVEPHDRLGEVSVWKSRTRGDR